MNRRSVLRGAALAGGAAYLTGCAGPGEPTSRGWPARPSGVDQPTPSPRRGAPRALPWVAGQPALNHRDLVHLSAAEVYAEISGCARVLRHMTGSIGAWFRPSQTPARHRGCAGRRSERRDRQLPLGHADTVAALPAILSGLRARGLRPVTTTELVTR